MHYLSTWQQSVLSTSPTELIMCYLLKIAQSNINEKWVHYVPDNHHYSVQAILKMCYLLKIAQIEWVHYAPDYMSVFSTSHIEDVLSTEDSTGRMCALYVSVQVILKMCYLLKIAQVECMHYAPDYMSVFSTSHTEDVLSTEDQALK